MATQKKPQGAPKGPRGRLKPHVESQPKHHMDLLRFSWTVDYIRKHIWL